MDNIIQPIRFGPEVPQLERTITIVPEEFRLITVCGIKPWYMISNYGRIWHIIDQKFLNYNIDSKGYLYKPLMTEDGQKNFRIHRLLMMTFFYFEGCEDYDVNHKDGITINNYYWNLEWATRSENMQHAYNMGLVNKLSPTRFKTITEFQAIRICQLLQENRQFDEIANIVGCSLDIVSSIQNKRAWTHISKDYNISSRMENRKPNDPLSENNIRKLCEYYRDYPNTLNQPLKYYCNDALKSIGIQAPTELQVRSAIKIKNRKTYIDISRDYNF